MVKQLRLLLRVAGGLALLGLLASLAFCCVTDAWYDYAFQRDLLSHLGASWSAVVLGVPIALGLRDLLLRRDMAEQQQARAEHARSVLGLLRRELELNGDLLLSRKGNEALLFSEPLKDDLWQALCRSGELPWVHEPEMLDRLASAYYHLRAVRELESAVAPVGTGVGLEADLSEGHRRYVEDLEDRALRHVVLALEMVDERLGLEATAD